MLLMNEVLHTYMTVTSDDDIILKSMEKATKIYMTLAEYTVHVFARIKAII